MDTKNPEVESCLKAADAARQCWDLADVLEAAANIQLPSTGTASTARVAAQPAERFSALFFAPRTLNMRKTMKKLLIFFVVFCAAITATAQSNTITFSASADYNGALPKTVKGFAGVLKSHETLPGGQVDLSAKLVSIVHLAMQFNYSQKPDNVQVTFTAGPEIDLGKNLFAHALVGGIHLSQKPPKVVSLGDSDFMYTVGGGARIPLGKRLFLSLGADYNYSEIFHSSDSFWKVSTGIGFRWGKS